MKNAVMFITYRLVAGASVPEFLEAAAKANGEHLSKQKGYVSWKQLLDGDTWADLVTWETAEDAQRASEACDDEASRAFFGFLDMDSMKMRMFSVEREFGDH